MPMNTASSPENPPHDGAGMGGSHILRVVLSREVWGGWRPRGVGCGKQSADGEVVKQKRGAANVALEPTEAWAQAGQPHRLTSLSQFRPCLGSQAGCGGKWGCPGP